MFLGMMLKRAGGHEIGVEGDDLLWGSIGGDLVVIDAQDTVEVGEEIKIVRHHDELLFKSGEFAANTIAVA